MVIIIIIITTIFIVERYHASVLFVMVEELAVLVRGMLVLHVSVRDACVACLCFVKTIFVCLLAFVQFG